jgi:hypothetical protein
MPEGLRGDTLGQSLKIFAKLVKSLPPQKKTMAIFEIVIILTKRAN